MLPRVIPVGLGFFTSSPVEGDKTIVVNAGVFSLANVLETGK